MTVNNIIQNDFDPVYIKKTLRTDKCSVTFIKEDGTQRVMICTLDPDYLPPQTDLEEHTGVGHPPSRDYVCVWDLQANGWRSFKFKSILSFEVITQ